MGRRSRDDGEAWIAVELRVPRWAAWCAAVGLLLMGAAALGGVTVLTWAVAR
ncbi:MULTISPECIES: hypothetical protein [Micromonospora]|uniref:hypothetical protein n=1 Tax=Micromonospora TaxID=1873 RepID=UPI00131A10ED|nr:MULTISPECIES: hypothetical protein [Micromonospora]NES14608.1 hypothetical protein [Micromonospora sp. PPF5-17B]NES35254.1 hypothetical protein [Micromonospora solifontis]